MGYGIQTGIFLLSEFFWGDWVIDSLKTAVIQRSRGSD